MDKAAQPTRRAFLQSSAAVAASTLLPAVPVSGSTCKLPMPPAAPPSRVVRYQSRKLVHGSRVHHQLLQEAFSRVLGAVANHEPDDKAAWLEILDPGDTIALKFNRSAQEAIGTTPAIGATIIDSLLSAGFPGDHIVCIEAPAQDLQRFHVRTARPEYSDTVYDFGSGRDNLLGALEHITAIINVPFVKTHNIAGITCALKNLSHGLVKHPARYHGNGCTPYIADINALEAIRNKLRLTVVDGLRVVFDRGPSATIETIENEGVLLATTDPVAADVTALTVINEVRERRGLPEIAPNGVCLPYLADAHSKGLGIAVSYGIETIRMGG